MLRLASLVGEEQAPSGLDQIRINQPAAVRLRAVPVDPEDDLGEPVDRGVAGVPDVYDEHERSLRALATTLVPGPDALWARGSR